MILFHRLYPATTPFPILWLAPQISQAFVAGKADDAGLHDCSKPAQISFGSRDSRASPEGEEIALLVMLMRQTCVPQRCIPDS